MRAAVCPELGPPEVVRIEDLPSPEVGDGQVRVGVEVAALNFPDVLLVAGTYQIPADPPFVPGSELAGTVLEVGAGVGHVAVGDPVVGTGLVGAFAEEVVLAAHAVQRRPPGVDADVGAASGVTYRTACHVLRSVARLAPGDQLVVLGAGGGVGSAAVQLGAQMGATVTAVASSPAKLDVARHLGATHLVEHRTVDLRRALRDLLPDGADVVVDPVGGALSEPALRSLRWGGRFVTVGFASGEIPRIPLNLVLLKGVQVLGFQFVDFATHAPDDLARNEAELAELLASGAVRPHIGATYPLERTAEALRLVADGQAVGKVLIRVAEGER
ncbi:MAG: NADPH:quinone oxidoreductase family protein [Acidimicrobiia bacterium]